MDFIINIYGGHLTVSNLDNSKLNDFLNNHFNKKFSYELLNSKYMLERNRHADVTVKLWSKDDCSISIGFLEDIIISLNEYTVWQNQSCNIKFIDNRILNPKLIKMPKQLLSGKSLRSYQNDAKQAYFKGTKCNTLEIITGGGKTLILIDIIRTIARTSLIIVEKKELLDQTYNELKDNLGLDIGYIGAGKINLQDISVATIQTLSRIMDIEKNKNQIILNLKFKVWKQYIIKHNIEVPLSLNKIKQLDLSSQELIDYTESVKSFDNKKKRFLNRYSLSIDEYQTYKIKFNEYMIKHNMIKSYLESIRFLIIDENHHSSADSYYNLGRLLKNTEFRLGTTATNRRIDGNDMKLVATTGKTIFSLTGQSLIDKGFLMRPNIIFVKPNISKEEHNVMVNASLVGTINEIPNYMLYYPNLIVKNKYRNNLIKQIVKMHTNSESILIITKLIEHGELLQQLIPNSVYINGNSAKKVRYDTLTKFKSGNLKILISTISIFAEGVDIPILDSVINASANKGDVKSIQLLGRILRKHKDKKAANYYDFADTGTFFFNASKARISAFKKEGHKISYLLENDMFKDNQSAVSIPKQIQTSL